MSRHASWQRNDDKGRRKLALLFLAAPGTGARRSRSLAKSAHAAPAMQPVPRLGGSNGQGRSPIPKANRTTFEPKGTEESIEA